MVLPQPWPWRRKRIDEELWSKNRPKRPEKVVWRNDEGGCASYKASQGLNGKRRGERRTTVGLIL